MWSDILLRFLGRGIARFLFLWPVSRSVRVASRSDRRLPRGLIAGCLEVSCAGRLDSRSQGTNFETKRFNFRCFFALPTEMSFTTSHYYPKYEVWAVEFFCGRIPLSLSDVQTTNRMSIYISKVIELNDLWSKKIYRPNMIV